MSELRVDKIVNSSGSGAVEFTGGITLPAGQTLSGIAQTAEGLTATASVNTTGIITATRFVGDGSFLTGVGATENTRTNSLVVSGVSTFSGNVNISGNLTIDGTTTTIDSVNLIIEDKNIGIGTTTAASNTTADGGGFTLFGGADGDKTLTWVNSTAAWTSNQDLNLTSGKVYEINGTPVLSSTQVLGKSVPSGTIVGDTDSQILSNKTLCSSTLTGTLTAGGGTGSNGQFLQSTGSGVQWATSSGGAIAGCCVSNFLSCNTCAPNISSATNNFFVGCNAGICITTGIGNVILGCNAGLSLTCGCWNNFFGICAGASQKGGTGNNYFGLGVAAGAVGGTYGSNNNMFGFCAGHSNTSGSYNNFFGNQAGRSNTTGCDNTFFGNQAGRSNTSGCHNIFFGKCAGAAGSSASNNIFLGLYAGQCTTGIYNIFFGKHAGRCTAGGNRNTFLGAYAGERNTTGSCNEFHGFRSGGLNTCGRLNTFSGFYSGYTNVSGCYNTFIGSQAGYYNQRGNCNVFVGRSSGYSVTGNCNVIIGSFAGTGFTACNNHIFLSDGAGNNRAQFNGSGALGLNGANYGTAGQVLTSCGSGMAPVWAAAGGGAAVSIDGNGTIFSCSTVGCGSGNFFMGCGAGVRSFGGGGFPECNIAIGAQAGQYSGACNVSKDNIFFGFQAGYYKSGGCNNFFAGKCAGRSGYNDFQSTTGSNNIAIGLFAGACLTSGSDNFFAGMCSGFDNTTGCNNIAIGCNSGNDFLYDFGATGGSNIIVIGNCSHVKSYVQVAWTTGSDQRDKTNIIPIPVGKEFLMQLNPVQYQWANRETGEVREEKPNYGFLAQDVLALENAPTVIVDDHDPEHLKMREGMIVPILVKTVQELIEEVDALKEEVRILKGE